MTTRRPKARGAAARTARPAWLRVFTRKPVQTIASAAFAATLTGIAVNALLMQSGKHPAPLFTWSPPVEPTHAATPVAAPVARSVDPVPAIAPIAPAVMPAVATPAVPTPVARPRDADPIASLLKGGATERAPVAAKPHKPAGRPD